MTLIKPIGKKSLTGLMPSYLAKKERAFNHTIHKDSQDWATVAQTMFGLNMALHTALIPAHL